jgi:hypothetical protein
MIRQEDPTPALIMPPSFEENPMMTYHLRAGATVTGRLLAIASAFLLCLVIALLAPAESEADAAEYGIEAVGASLSTHEAGRHPDVTTSVDFVPQVTEPPADTEELAIELPAGLTANPRNFPTCSFIKFNNPFVNPCPVDSQVGLVEVKFRGSATYLREPLYSLTAPEDEVVRLGFIGLIFSYYLEVDLRSGTDYGVTVKSRNMPNGLTLESVRSTVWGVPADPIHDTERVTPFEALFCLGSDPANEPCAGGSRKSGLSPEPLMTNPASCGPMNFRFIASSYAVAGKKFEATADAGEITDCGSVPFEPTLSLSTTSRRAGAPTGLEAILEVPQNEAVNTVNASPVRRAKVALPEGLRVNASAADGLQACGDEEARIGTDGPANCPEGAKIGTLEITSPPLKRPIKGGIYLRTPVTGHLIQFWLVSNELGVNLKLPGEVELDQETGRMTAVIPESPQVPAEKVALRFNSGARAPLRNGLACGTATASYEFAPWSGNPPADGVVPITVDEGCSAGGFDPKLSAGTVSPSAGAFSPFVFDVSREDDEANLASVEVSLPKGLVAKIAGVPLCSDVSAASGACPAASKIGIIRAAVGAGTQPLWIPQPGKDPTAAFLAGPYKEAPFSVVAEVPAQAGPFDLGVVTVRSGIYIDPRTAQVTVKSDPLPQILQGIPIDYRRVRVEVDRDRFTLNPTSCAEQMVAASIGSISGASATPTARFQAADCASLGFSPKLSLKLSGGTQRGDHPRLRAVLRAKPGDANIRRASVALPHSEFLEQAHIRTVCTRVQFAADACPAGSIYGSARATSPLLDAPLRGPVYLRSSSHQLPDLVVDLKGEVRVTLVGRIDSANGGIRTTFEAAPDASIRRFVLNMKGGAKGLLVNSRNLCLAPNRATVRMRGHNGRSSNTRPALKNGC